jgi:hypothetical protein
MEVWHPETHIFECFKVFELISQDRGSKICIVYSVPNTPLKLRALLM